LVRSLRLAGRVTATVVLVACALLGARWMWRRGEADPWTRDGRVRADIVAVAPDVSGLVTEVRVQDNAAVRRGQVLFVIDPSRYQLALEQAQGALATSRAALDQAMREDRRNRALGADLVPAETVEEGAAKVEQLRAALQQAVAARDLAALNLQRTRVVAPVDGVVTNTEMRPGDYLAAGHPAMALVYGGSLHVDGYFEETKLPAVRVGDPARVELMGVAVPIQGHVESIAGGVEDRERAAAGDLLANVNPTFSWVRLPQRIPIRIAIDKVPRGVRLIPGSTATVIVAPRIARPLAPRSFLW
jgi:RND family efflux transporter MFP subunit